LFEGVAQRYGLGLVTGYQGKDVAFGAVQVKAGCGEFVPCAGGGLGQSGAAPGVLSDDS
jgi:hypothetical protein